ncbi:MAG: hypothetical protein K2N75_01455 [Helicobacter sp.]|uniref:hypothetical protein n=1 Tax=Helicobacter sp. TaxID=218 RepID=UPI0023D00A56|nr:hypothetical protein [Helicobacter sp.]MDE5925317.1 hypothetical protein [Helicobacter sp.]MDE7174704.1 hypothetical protein [Helicobacter sp.]
MESRFLDSIVKVALCLIMIATALKGFAMTKSAFYLNPIINCRNSAKIESCKDIEF